MKKCRQYAAFIGFSPFFVVQLRLWICLRSKLSKQIVHNHLPGKAKRVYPRNSTNWISSAVHTLKKKGKCWTPNILQSHWQAGLQCLSISQLDIIYDLFGIRKSFAQRLEQETDALSLWRIISNVSQTVERIVTTRTKNAFTNIHKLFCLETAEAFLRNLLFSPCIHHGENFYSDVSFKLKGIWSLLTIIKMPLVTSPWLQFDKLGHSALEPPEDTFTSIVVLKRIMSSFRIVPLLWHDGSFHYRNLLRRISGAPAQDCMETPLSW